MAIPLRIAFHDVPHSDALEARIRGEATRLDRLFGDILSCHVAVEMPHRRHRQGTLFHLRIDLSLPGRKLVVNKEPGDRNAHEDPYVMVRDAFDAIERQIKQYRGITRRDVKRHVSLPRGQVVRIFSDQGYGFLESDDGQEYYFHRNSVLNDGFDRLRVGMEVRFAEEVGEKGPQASTVEIAERSKTRQAAHQGLAA